LVHPERADYLSFQRADDLLAENRGSSWWTILEKLAVKKLLGGFVAVKLVGATALATTTSAEARLEELGVRVRGAKGINLQKRAENIETCMRAADPTKLPELQKVAKT
jgi:hypothetical protein